MVKSHIVGIPDIFEIVPLGRSSIITCLHFMVRVNLYMVSKSHNMLSGISVWLAVNAYQFWLFPTDVALFLEFSYHCVFWIFTIIYETTREGIMAFKRIFSSSNKQNESLTGILWILLCNKGITSQCWISINLWLSRLIIWIIRFHLYNMFFIILYLFIWSI